MKRKFYLATAVLATFCVSILVSASHPWLGKTLSAEQVKKRWGAENFSESAFKQGDQAVRARMAYSLMTSKKMRGLSPSEVRAKLGDFDGHYFSESYPTYLIQVAQDKTGESWQIVFLINSEQKTKDVIVHKNCCD